MSLMTQASHRLWSGWRSGAAMVRFGSDEKKPSKTAQPTILTVPAGSESYDDVQIMAKKLYEAMMHDLLDQQPAVWSELPLPEKAALIRQFRDVMTTATHQRVLGNTRKELHHMVLERLYQSVQEDILDQSPDELAKASLETRDLQATVLHDLTWLYRLTGAPMPTIQGLLNPVDSQNALTPIDNLSPETLAAATRQLKQREDRNALQEMLRRLYEAFKPTVFLKRPAGLTHTGDRQKLASTLQSLNATAQLLSTPLEQDSTPEKKPATSDQKADMKPGSRLDKQG